ncbi:MAG: acyl carrier protein [Desulfobacteraceae bacterium]|nr:MAG: acyl carrier protein [Desulfobacteraceae bacterium]
MNREEVFHEMVAIIKEYVRDPELLKHVTNHTNIINDLRVNSARLVDIIIKSEDVFHIEINDDDADRIKTLGDAVDVVLSLKRAA